MEPKKRKVRRIRKFKRRGDMNNAFWVMDNESKGKKLCPKCKLASLRTDMKYVWCSLVDCHYYTKFKGGVLG